MRFLDNPIFLTQRRLVHRGGVVAVLILAVIIGFSFLSGLLAFLSGSSSMYFISKAAAGKVFYGWVVAVELILLPFLGATRIARAVSDDRKAGLWESNRLTPLTPAQLVTGYWFGAPLREYYAAAVLAVCGLTIVLLAGLPLTLWVGTQVLIASTALFLGLLGALLGITSQRQEGGLMLFLILLIAGPVSLVQGRLLMTNFLLPIFGIANLFAGEDDSDIWTSAPSFFGVPVPGIVLTLVLQFLVGLFLWQAATRKAANPFQPLLERWQAIVLFAVLLLAQHGLMWGAWGGHYPVIFASPSLEGEPENVIMGLVQCCTMFMGLIVLAFIALQPEQVRLAALRAGRASFRLVLARSAVGPAIAFATLAGVFLLTHFLFSFGTQANEHYHTRMVYAIAVLNLLAFFLIFTLMLEYCRLRFRQRAAGFVGLGLFILCVLPYILMGVFSEDAFGWGSLLSPGVLALTADYGDGISPLFCISLVHLGLAGLLFAFWRREAKRLLDRAVAG